MRTPAGGHINCAVTALLLDVLAGERAGRDEATRAACLDSALEVCRGADLALGLAAASPGSRAHVPDFAPELRERLHRAAKESFDASPRYKPVAVRILARTQLLPVLLAVVGKDIQFLAVALTELFYVLKEPIECFNRYQVMDDVGKQWACDLLRRVADQRAGSALAPAPCAVHWVRELEYKKGGRYEMEKRLVLVALLCGPETVAQLLTTAMDNRDENLIGAASRALSYIIDDLISAYGALVRGPPLSLRAVCARTLLML